MSSFLFEKGREGLADGTVDFDTNTMKMILLDTGTADVGIKAITAASNATPIVLTVTAHGFTNGDLVYVDGVLGNLAANGLWKVANQATNTFELTDPITGANVVGSAAYTSGGFVVNLGSSAAGDNLDDFDGARVGTDQTLTSATALKGVLDAADPTWTALTGASIEAAMIYKDTGSAATSRCVILMVGRQIIVCAAQAAAASTTINVERVSGIIPSGAVLTFSNGASATLTAQANVGDRTLTVSSTAAIITSGSKALALSNGASGQNFPFTPNGGNLTITFDTNGIIRI